jgi:predicted permease
VPFLPLAEALLPTLVVVAVGYSLARWMGLSTAPLITLLRFVFLPVYLFMMLPARLSPDRILIIALIGGAIVAVGVLIHRNAHRVFKTRVPDSVAIPNIALFSIPLFALSWGGRGIGTACALFVGVSITAFIFEKKSFPKLFQQPWLYAVVAGILLVEFQGSVEPFDVILSPFLGATIPLLLLLLGASLHPLKGFLDLDAWVTAILRVGVGFLVALLGVTLLPVSPAVAAGAVMASMAPAATKALSLAGPAKDSPSDRGPGNVGALVSLIVFALFFLTGWEPW